MLDFGISSWSSWSALFQIILIDILLGGDNALVIGIACQKLPPDLRKKGIFFGALGAILLRVLFIIGIVYILEIPLLRMIGGLLLFSVAIKLMLAENEHAPDVLPKDQLWGAIKTIIVADAVMSLDNVLAIASAAKRANEEHQLLLIILGLLFSIPLIIFGSKLIIKLMDRFPIIIMLGSVMLGWIAGGIIVTDPVLEDWLLNAIPQSGLPIAANTIASCVGALIILAIGMFIKRKRSKFSS